MSGGTPWAESAFLGPGTVKARPVISVDIADPAIRDSAGIPGADLGRAAP
ncbi:hypothetical protein GCM10023085_28170 [Actinomadura viridis]